MSDHDDEFEYIRTELEALSKDKLIQEVISRIQDQQQMLIDNWHDNKEIRRPAGEVLFHRKTGQTIDPLAQMQQLPPIDQNPTALSIKNDKNLNNDEKIKRLIALGYANA